MVSPVTGTGTTMARHFLDCRRGMQLKGPGRTDTFAKHVFDTSNDRDLGLDHSLPNRTRVGNEMNAWVLSACRAAH